MTYQDIFAAWFLVERLLKPRLGPGPATIDPQEYERLVRESRGFIAFSLRPNKAGSYSCVIVMS